MGRVGPGELLLGLLIFALPLGVVFAGGFMTGYFMGKAKGYRQAMQDARPRDRG